MTYSISINSNITVIDDLMLNKMQYQLPTTQFDAISPAQNIINTISLVPANTTQTFSLLPLGSHLLVLAIKMSRPAIVTLVSPPVPPATSDILFTAIPTTYFNYVFNTTESSSATVVNSVQISAPAALTKPPTGAPLNYPNCLVELFALVQLPSN